MTSITIFEFGAVQRIPKVQTCARHVELDNWCTTRSIASVGGDTAETSLLKVSMKWGIDSATPGGRSAELVPLGDMTAHQAEI